MLAKRGNKVVSHEEIENLISHRRNPQKSPVTSTCWEHYRFLQNTSEASRYNGFKDRSTWIEHQKKELDKCLVSLEYIRKYVHHKHKVPVLKEQPK